MIAALKRLLSTLGAAFGLRARTRATAPASDGGSRPAPAARTAAGAPAVAGYARRIQETDFCLPARLQAVERMNTRAGRKPYQAPRRMPAAKPIPKSARGGKKVHLSLAANPSHLEAINPVIEGMVRAKQNRLGDRERVRVVPVLLHGDAAVTGQGIVAETLWLSELDAYRTGGTVHLIVNNQVGFTTPPESYRFTRYPSDFAKIAEAAARHRRADRRAQP